MGKGTFDHYNMMTKSPSHFGTQLFDLRLKYGLETRQEITTIMLSLGSKYAEWQLLLRSQIMRGYKDFYLSSRSFLSTAVFLICLRLILETNNLFQACLWSDVVLEKGTFDHYNMMTKSQSDSGNKLLV